MRLDNSVAFASEPLDRAGKRRSDPAWLAEALHNPQTRIALFHQRKPLVADTPEGLKIAWISPQAATPGDVGALLFLGVDAQGGAVFAQEIGEPHAVAALGVFEDLRKAGLSLAADELAILGTAKAVFEWHARHGFCANCGAATAIVEAGWRRDCAACDAQHFPRVDPVVIMAPIYQGRCLLARQSRFPPRMISALAGFVEPGETIASAVARETLEEAGLKTTDVRVCFTQPWPFPSSLMVGALCTVESEALNIDLDELEFARWFTREEVARLLAGAHPEFFAPPPFAIAHQLLKLWLEET
jgi:NAD+ diphosphatase